VIRIQIALSNVCSNLRGASAVSLARLQHEMKAMPMRTVEVRTRNQGKVEYPKSQAFWAVRKRIRCTKIEGNAEAGQKQARSSINDTAACRAGDDRARESGHPRFHRRRPCLSTGLSRRLAPSTGLAPSTFCGGMEAWLTWSMPGLSHAWARPRPTPDAALAMLAARGDLWAASERVLNQMM
jgi:hypothetical protein